VSSEAALGGFAAYFFDLDGTLVYPDRAIPGAAEAIAALRSAGKRLAVITNNSFLSREALGARLAEFGFDFRAEELVSATVAAARYIAREQPGARVHVLGSPGLRVELRAAGLRPTTSRSADFVLVGNDPAVTYARLTRAMRALLAGSRFVAVNRDSRIYAPEGSLIGCGALVAALCSATEREPELVAGKPGPSMLLEAARASGQPPERCVYVGDMITTDVQAARAAGMASALVLTGVTRPEQLDQPGLPRPDFVIPTLDALADALPAPVTR
jgi:HAD superfamily hydrolase (TIGR01450 family)